MMIGVEDHQQTIQQQHAMTLLRGLAKLGNVCCLYLQIVIVHVMLVSDFLYL